VTGELVAAGVALLTRRENFVEKILGYARLLIGCHRIPQPFVS
jgi:hypothetical protein